MKKILESLKIFLFMSLLAGVLYPFFILAVATFFVPWKSSGSFVEKNGHIIGSKKIAQAFYSDIYFWPRPSYSNYNTMPAEASNLGPTSAKLKKLLEERKLKIAIAHNIKNLEEVPIELICATASGIDPHISLEAAHFQIERVSKARSLDKNIILQLILDSTEKPLGRLFGSEYINVLMLNLLLDNYSLKAN